VTKWKHRAAKVVVANAMLVMYDTFFKEHTFLKLEVIAWQQKTRKREARWNEFKGELNVILDVTPLFTLVNEVTYHQMLMNYRPLQQIKVYLTKNPSKKGPKINPNLKDHSIILDKSVLTLSNLSDGLLTNHRVTFLIDQFGKWPT
jgi:hypothetical protein